MMIAMRTRSKIVKKITIGLINRSDMGIEDVRKKLKEWLYTEIEEYVDNSFKDFDEKAKKEVSREEFVYAIKRNLLTILLEDDKNFKKGNNEQ